MILRNAATIFFIFLALIQCFLINMYMLSDSAYAYVCLAFAFTTSLKDIAHNYYGNRCPYKIDVLQ